MNDTQDHVLVTGGGGFIGSAVVRALLAEGKKVTVLDTFDTGSRRNLVSHANLVIVEGDVRDAGLLEKLAKDATHVVHLAAQVSVPRSVENPEETYEMNVIGTRNALEAAKNAGAKRFAYASSAAVYGNAPALPKHEDHVLEPASPYAASKIENEKDAARYAKEYGLRTVGLRFFNVYGPGQSADGAYASLIPRWLADVRNGRAPEVYGDGTQTRDLVHVTDVANAVVKALTEDVPPGSVYNVASGKEYSLLEIWDIIRKAGNSSLELTRMPPRAGDIGRSVADITRIREELGFSPDITLEEGFSGLLP